MEGSEHQNPPCQQRMGYNLNYDWSTHLRAGYNLILASEPSGKILASEPSSKILSAVHCIQIDRCV